MRCTESKGCLAACASLLFFSVPIGAKQRAGHNTVQQRLRSDQCLWQELLLEPGEHAYHLEGSMCIWASETFPQLPRKNQRTRARLLTQLQIS
jgi:hypothetical protein